MLHHKVKLPKMKDHIREPTQGELDTLRNWAGWENNEEMSRPTSRVGCDIFYCNLNPITVFSS